jgi:cell division protein FtsZ
MVLGEEEKIAAPVPMQQPVAEVVKDPFEPHMQEPVVEEVTISVEHSSAIFYSEDVPAVAEPVIENDVLRFELSVDLPETVAVAEPVQEAVPEPVAVAKTALEELNVFTVTDQPSQPIVNRFGGLSKPNNIYAATEEPVSAKVETPVAKVEEVIAVAPVPAPTPAPAPQMFVKEEEAMQLVMREAYVPETPKQVMPVQAAFPQEDEYLDEAEEQKRRAAERIQKLRNLSFNMNTTDPNNEFDSVPAYIRRNMELFGSTLTSVENFYSKVTVGKDSNNQTQLSTINTFLDGKKPD